MKFESYLSEGQAQIPFSLSSALKLMILPVPKLVTLDLVKGSIIQGAFENKEQILKLTHIYFY